MDGRRKISSVITLILQLRNFVDAPLLSASVSLLFPLFSSLSLKYANAGIYNLNARAFTRRQVYRSRHTHVYTHTYVHTDSSSVIPNRTVIPRRRKWTSHVIPALASKSRVVASESVARLRREFRRPSSPAGAQQQGTKLNDTFVAERIYLIILSAAIRE